MSALIEKDQIEVPERNKFECAVMEVNESTPTSTIAGLSVGECQVKDKPSADATFVLHELKQANDLYQLGHFGLGFMDQAALDKAYPDQSTGIAKKLKDLMSPDYYLALYKTKSAGVYTDTIIALKLQEAKFLEFINATVAQDLTYIDDFNIVPFYASNEIEIDYIDDKTRTFVSEASLTEYFTDKFIGIKSKNYFLDLSQGGGFINNYLFFTNTTVELKLKVDQRYLSLKNPADGTTVEVIDTRKIYKCYVYYNVVPFSTNPRDQSWCGLAFPYGDRDTIISTSVKFIFIKKVAKAVDCVKAARQLQNSIYTMCSKDLTPLYNKIYKSQEESMRPEQGPLMAAAEIIQEDSERNPSGQAIAFRGAAELDGLAQASLKSEFEGSHVVMLDLKSAAHYPSKDREKVKLDRVLNSLLPTIEGLDPDEYFINGVTNLSPKYKPEYVSYEDQQAWYKKEVERRDENYEGLRFSNVNIVTVDKSVMRVSKPNKPNLLKAYSKMLMEKTLFQIHSAQDKTMITAETIDTIRYWIKKLGDIKSLLGRGVGINLPEVIYPLIAKRLVKDELTQEEQEQEGSISYLWYDLMYDPVTSVTTKVFKTFGKPDGDVLQTKVNCCGVLTSSVAKTTIVICPHTLKIAKEGEAPKFVDVYGASIPEEAFLAELGQCAGPTPAAVPLRPVPEEYDEDLNVTLNAGTLALPKPGGVVTTVKDGNVIRDDGSVKVVDNVATQATTVTKPEEQVEVKVDPLTGKVVETVTPNAADPIVTELPAAAQVDQAIEQAIQQQDTLKAAEEAQKVQQQQQQQQALATLLAAPSSPRQPGTSPTVPGGSPPAPVPVVLDPATPRVAQPSPALADQPATTPSPAGPTAVNSALPGFPASAAVPAVPNVLGTQSPAKHPAVPTLSISPTLPQIDPITGAPIPNTPGPNPSTTTQNQAVPNNLTVPTNPAVPTNPNTQSTPNIPNSQNVPSFSPNAPNVSPNAPNVSPNATNGPNAANPANDVAISANQANPSVAGQLGVPAASPVGSPSAPGIPAHSQPDAARPSTPAALNPTPVSSANVNSPAASPVALGGESGIPVSPKIRANPKKLQNPIQPNEPGDPVSPGHRKKKPLAKGPKIETPVGDLPIGDDNCYWRDLGYYNICIDKENKVTVHEKSGESRDEFEHVQDAYREGNIVWIKFANGNVLKHYLKENETVKLYHNKEIVEHVFPDKSIVVDDKAKKLKSINNKYGVSATFDILGNKFLDKEVKSHFKYGSDIIYVLSDDTKIIKKGSGESVVMKPDGTVETFDKFGQAKFRQDNGRGLRFAYSSPKSTDTYLDVYDSILHHDFRMLANSSLIREKSTLYEKLPGNTKLEIAYQFGYVFKRRQNGQYEERCYDNYKGVRIGVKNIAYKCNCDYRYILDLWSCEKSSKRDAFKYVLTGLNKETYKDKLNNYKDHHLNFVYNDDLKLLRKLNI